MGGGGYIIWRGGLDSNVNDCDVISDVTVTVDDVSLRHLIGGLQVPSSNVRLDDGSSIRSLVVN